MKKILASGFAVLAAAALSTEAVAGGLERGGYNIDLLFDNSPFIFDSSITYVMPKRKLKNVRDTDPTDGNLNDLGFSSDADETENYAVPRIGMKAGIGEAIDCMIDYSEPWGAHSNPGTGWAGAQSVTEIEVYSRNYGGTCSYKFDVGPGQLRIIGGGFYQEVGGFKDALVLPGLSPLGFSGIGRLEDMEGDGGGWRAGIAYEIPEYAMRASLVYNSKVDLGDVTGTLDLTEVPAFVLPPGDPRRSLFGVATPVFGTATMPEVIELKLQSGIAPDWLAFGSVKWTNWSRLQSVAFCPVALRGLGSCVTGGPLEATSLDLLYRDGWTISGGIGHKFNEQWSGAASLTWDRGTSTGVGHQTDSWTVGVGGAYTPTEHVELRFGGALGILTSGSSGVEVRNGVVFGDDVSYDFGTDLVTALTASLKVKF
ncbi:MAG: OmpP1/FadL family transporter [Shinella sp.]|nr:OmpP1/FadL family transporter [Shinella sp.]